MRTSIVLSGLLPLLATTSPVDKRAGAPSVTPIPAKCTVGNPLPHANCGTANVDGYQPDPAFVKANLLYQAYFDSSLTQAQQAKQCSEQCYGYGNTGDCKSAFMAYNVPVPKGYHGSKGGNLEAACLLFGGWCTPLDFVEAKKGQYVNATAADIFCPK